MVPSHFGSVVAALQNVDRTQLDRLLKQVRACQGTIWLCGNGGSFATAQHWALDLTKAAHRRAAALGSCLPLMLAWANDERFEFVFAAELRRFAQPGDVLIALSCSGTSPNVAGAIAAAKEHQVTSVLLTGTVNAEVTPADHILRVWSQDYAVIEDCHSVIGHWLTKALTR